MPLNQISEQTVKQFSSASVQQNVLHESVVDEIVTALSMKVLFEKL